MMTICIQDYATFQCVGINTLCEICQRYHWKGRSLPWSIKHQNHQLDVPTRKNDLFWSTETTMVHSCKKCVSLIPRWMKKKMQVELVCRLLMCIWTGEINTEFALVPWICQPCCNSCAHLQNGHGYCRYVLRWTGRRYFSCVMTTDVVRAQLRADWVGGGSQQSNFTN